MAAQITPTELKFRFQLNRTMPNNIEVHNPTSERIAFKVKTTNPKRYMVRPSSGVVEAQSTSSVQIQMQTAREVPSDLNNCKDKFMVQTAALLPGEELTPDVFQRSNKQETKLKVVLEGSGGPPSPVQEEPEVDAEGPKIAQPTSPVPAGDKVPSSNDQVKKAEEPRDVLRLQEELTKLKRENDILKAQLKEKAQPIPTSRIPAGPTTKQPVTKPKTSTRLPILSILLVAIFAFVLGHLSAPEQMKVLQTKIPEIMGMLGIQPPAAAPVVYEQPGAFEAPEEQPISAPVSDEL